jgi:hypothetical protein
MIKRLKTIGTVVHYTILFTLYVAILCLAAVMLVEWMSGCGETYTDANGVTHTHECMFIPMRKENAKHNGTSQNNTKQLT